MSKLTKEKRSQVLLATVMIVVVLVGLWSILIRYQQNKLTDLARKKSSSEMKLGRIADIIRNSREIEAELLVVSNKLSLQEQKMMSGDLYSSLVAMIRKFKQSYDLEIPQLNSGGNETEVNLLPKFPYKQATLSIAGSGNFFEVGRFISDFENQFSTARILNLELAPASVQNPEEQKKLFFKLDIVCLVKSGRNRPANAL